MQTNLSVLVVDDDHVIRSLVRVVLARAGYTVATARDGVEALEMLTGAHYDAVILDVMMPRLDGLGVVERLEQTAPAILDRTLLLTASNLRRLDELPVFGVMAKPFEMEELLRQTQACIANGRVENRETGMAMQMLSGRPSDLLFAFALGER
ncbi:MAG TPA: response regulator [Thermoanaerobaculia bacterium]|nr:response regulator [Thermoanaerobaculia bacterium]